MRGQVRSTVGTMTVHVLIVEDEAEFVDELQQVFAELEPPIEVQVATSRDAALTALNNDFFDLIVLDLKLPTVAEALDADVNRLKRQREALGARGCCLHRHPDSCAHRVIC